MSDVIPGERLTVTAFVFLTRRFAASTKGKSHQDFIELKPAGGERKTPDRERQSQPRRLSGNRLHHQGTVSLAPQMHNGIREEASCHEDCARGQRLEKV